MDKTQICNMALSLCADKTISSFQEDSPKAIKLRAVFDLCRDIGLYWNDWSFARKTSSLTRSNEEIDGYDYVYVYPSDCLSIRSVYDVQGKIYQGIPLKNEIIYTVFASKNKSEKLIATNIKLARLRYTAVVDNTELWSPVFVEALSYLIASKIVKAETGSKEGDALYKNFVNLINLAKSLDFEEQKPAFQFKRPRTSIWKGSGHGFNS